MNELKENKTIIHYCNTEHGSSGSPILSLNSNKVIGIHYGGSTNNNFEFNYGTYIKYAIDEMNKKYKNEINLKYITKEEKQENIFGVKFVENNINNIDLIINGENSKLNKEYKLLKGVNDIKMIIKNKITNIEYMFYKCHSLKEINELKFLDIKDINNIEKKNKDISIKIDNSRKTYTNSDIDITIIEIKPEEDKINNYLEIDEEEITEKQYKKKSIYILHCPNKRYVSYGLINALREYKTILHYCNTEHGSSGSPILSLNSNKVIGIH